jgi:hypothetical protein
MPTGQAFEESTQTLHSLERNAEESRPGRRLHWTSRRCRVWKAVQMILVRDHPPHRFKMLASLSLLDWTVPGVRGAGVRGAGAEGEM